MRTTIDWKEVKRMMIERDIDTYAQLARMTDIHKNSMGRVGPFTSTTLDKLATCLGCDPCKLIAVEDDDQPATPAPKASDAARQSQRSALAPPAATATPQQLAAEAERRQMLLEQAKGRGA